MAVIEREIAETCRSFSANWRWPTSYPRKIWPLKPFHLGETRPLINSTRELWLTQTRIEMISPFKFFKAFFSLLAGAGFVLGILLLLFLVLSGLMIWFESGSHGFWNMLYLSAITALTVGYGDYAPQSVGGRIASVGLALDGIVFVGIIVAAATNAMGQAAPDS
jgi:hypothetical protein